MQTNGDQGSRNTTPSKNGAVSSSFTIDHRDDTPPMMQVLNRLPEFPILGDQIKDQLTFRCMGDL